MAEAQRPLVGLDQLLLAFELFGGELLHDAEVDVEKRGEGADIDDVAEELALPRVSVLRGADLCERHAERHDVVTRYGGRQRAGRIVEE